MLMVHYNSIDVFRGERGCVSAPRTPGANATGLALLRSNGRKALRIQCAWRALLVWTPVAALLVLSVLLDNVWLGAWFRQIVEPYAWAYWLSWLCWGFALSLLPLYVGLAFWLPNRSLHDRLAGTYLVPR
jgi:eukaryotic-like serine/threonine-protein kinase